MTYLGLFLVSLAGSTHCVAMCGGFMACCLTSRNKSTRVQLSYHLGRLASYLMLGMVAGAFGTVLQRSAPSVLAADLLGYFLGALLIAWGLLLAFSPNGRPAALSSVKDGRIGRLYARAFGNASRRSPCVFALTIGLLSALLPCGWLYLFVAAAAGTFSVLQGALVMAVFWLGTVPWLAAFAYLVGLTSQRFRVFLPRVTAAILIASGLFSIRAHHAVAEGRKAASCHDTHIHEH